VAAPGAEKSVAKRLQGNQGGRREKIVRPQAATDLRRRLRNRNRNHRKAGKRMRVGEVVEWHGIAL
jgi:hypothetical protein